MHQSILSMLACPRDRAYPLIVDVVEWTGEDEIETGTLRCPACGTDFSITRGIADLCELNGTASDVEAKRSEMAGRDFEAAESYDQQFTSYQTRAELDAVLRRLRLGRHDTVLEVGCGNGRLSWPFLERAATYIGVDYSMESLRTFQFRLGPRAIGLRRAVNLIRADANNLPFRADSQFDRVVAAQVLEHIPTPKLRHAFLVAVRDFLAPGGILVLTTYNYDWLLRWRGEPRWGIHDLGIYYFRYDAHRLRRELGTWFARVEVNGIRNRLVPERVLDHGGAASIWVDRLISRFSSSCVTGRLLIARCEARQGPFQRGAADRALGPTNTALDALMPSSVPLTTT